MKNICLLLRLRGEKMAVVLAILAGLITGFAISGLIWWGIGSLVVWAFGIAFVWTYWHGLAVAIILSALRSVLTVRVKED